MENTAFAEITGACSRSVHATRHRWNCKLDAKTKNMQQVGTPCHAVGVPLCTLIPRRFPPSIETFPTGA